MPISKVSSFFPDSVDLGVHCLSEQTAAEVALLVWVGSMKVTSSSAFFNAESSFRESECAAVEMSISIAGGLVTVTVPTVVEPCTVEF